MNQELIAFLQGTEVGRVRQVANGLLEFEYESAWRKADTSFPLSISMPLSAGRHRHDVVYAYLSGLLPDNDRVLDAWGRRFGVSPRNPFALLANVGEDCAGAVQFVQPDRLSSFRQGKHDGVEWLSEADIAERLRLLRTDNAAWRRVGDTGQFSLAGAQPKTALLNDGDRWGVPSGRIPTTHILKPPSAEFDGLIEDEHFCLELAGRIGLPTAHTTVMRFGHEVAIVAERYDRVIVDGKLVRVHQEDLCQALAVPPLRRYENEGGPGIAQIVDLLRTHSASPVEDINSFLQAVAFNWAIGATDGHAKNFSILIGAAGRTRLAPLYDVATALPFPNLNERRVKLAMRVGGEYGMRKIGRIQWVKTAKQSRADSERLVQSIADLLNRIPPAVAETLRDITQSGLKHPIVARTADVILARVRKLAREFPHQVTPTRK